MATTDEAISNLCEVMAARYGAGLDFRIALDEMVAKIREAHERRMRDAQAAELLHDGWRPLAERFGVCKATVYNMAERGRASKREQAV